MSYNPISIANLDSIFNNEILLSFEEGFKPLPTTFFITALSNQLRNANIPYPWTLSVAGSSLRFLYAHSGHPSDPVCNDLDIKLTIKGYGLNRKQTRDIITLSKKIIFATFCDLAPECESKKFYYNSFKPVTIPYSRAFIGYTLPASANNLPVEFSTVVLNKASEPEYVLNIDSLYIPLLWKDSECKIWEQEPGKYLLYSHQNHANIVICDIAHRVLKANLSSNIGKYGWTRLIMSAVDGMPHPSLEGIQSLYDQEIKKENPETKREDHYKTLIYDMYKYVQNKRPPHLYCTPQYWLFYLCNALFHSCEKDEMQTVLSSHLIDCVRQEKKIFWICFLQTLPLQSFNSRDLNIALKLLLPLLAQRIIPKEHLGQDQILCEFEQKDHPGRPLHIIIPFIDPSDKEALDSLLPLLISSNASLPFPLYFSYSAIPIFPISSIPLILSLYQTENPFCQDLATQWALKFPHHFKDLIRKIGLETLRQKQKPTSYQETCLIAMGVCPENLASSLLAKTQLLKDEITSSSPCLETISTCLEDYDMALLAPLQKKQLLQILARFPSYDFVFTILSSCPEQERTDLFFSFFKELIDTKKLSAIETTAWQSLSRCLPLLLENTQQEATIGRELVKSLLSCVFGEENTDFLSACLFVDRLTNIFPSFHFEKDPLSSFRLFTALKEINPDKAIFQLESLLNSDFSKNASKEIENLFKEHPFKQVDFLEKLLPLIEKTDTKKGLCFLQCCDLLMGACCPLLIIWASYTHFYENAGIALHIETHYFSPEKAKTFLFQAAPENCSSYQKALLFRIHSLLTENKVKAAKALSLYLPMLSVTAKENAELLIESIDCISATQAQIILTLLPFLDDPSLESLEKRLVNKSLQCKNKDFKAHLSFLTTLNFLPTTSLYSQILDLANLRLPELDNIATMQVLTIAQSHSHKPDHSLEEKQLQLALKCIDKLPEVISCDIDFTWTIDKISQKITDPALIESAKKIVWLSSATAVRFVEKFYDHIKSTPFSSPIWEDLHCFLISLAYIPKKSESRAITVLRSLSKHIKSLSKKDQSSKQVVLCIEKIIEFILKTKKKDAFDIAKNLIAVLPISAHFPLYCQYVEEAIIQHKILNDDSYFFLENLTTTIADSSSLLPCFLETASKICTVGNEGSLSLEIALFTLELQKKKNLSIDKKFKAPEYIANLVSFSARSFNASWEFLNFLTTYTSIMIESDSPASNFCDPNFADNFFKKGTEIFIKEHPPGTLVDIEILKKQIGQICDLFVGAYIACLSSQSPLKHKFLSLTTNFILDLKPITFKDPKTITLPADLENIKAESLSKCCLTIILQTLLEKQLLKGDFFYELAKKIEIHTKTSLYAAYIEIFSNYISKPVSWKMLCEIVEGIRLNPPNTDPDENSQLSALSFIFTICIENLSIRQKHTPGTDPLLDPILHLYLKLINRSSHLRFPGAFIQSLIKAPACFTTNDHNLYIMNALKKIAERSPYFLYTEEQIEGKTPFKIVALYGTVLTRLSSEEKELFQPTLDKITKELEPHIENPSNYLFQGKTS